MRPGSCSGDREALGTWSVGARREVSSCCSSGSSTAGVGAGRSQEAYFETVSYSIFIYIQYFYLDAVLIGGDLGELLEIQGGFSSPDGTVDASSLGSNEETPQTGSWI